MIKIVQFGDLHLDGALENSKAQTAKLRRLGARKLLQDAISYANRAEADIILCTGDIFDNLTPYLETQTAVTEAFAQTEIPIFVTPGNHDYYSLSSPWHELRFSDNVHIFKSQHPESVVLEELGVCITGMASTQAKQAMRPLKDFTAPEGCLNILISHGDLTSSETDYFAFSKEEIGKAGFVYVALGHAHAFKAEHFENTLIVQNGSMEGRGYDEPGEKGLVFATISPSLTKAELVPQEGSRCVRTELDISGLDFAEIIKRLKRASPYGPSRTVLRARLFGNGEVDAKAIADEMDDHLAFKLVSDVNLYREADMEMGIDESGLSGDFVAKMKVKIAAAKDEEERQILEKALKYGLLALRGAEQPHFIKEAGIDAI